MYIPFKYGMCQTLIPGDMKSKLTFFFDGLLNFAQKNLIDYAGFYGVVKGIFIRQNGHNRHRKIN